MSHYTQKNDNWIDEIIRCKTEGCKKVGPYAGYCSAHALQKKEEDKFYYEPRFTFNDYCNEPND
jgi:hypothetical protein